MGFTGSGMVITLREMRHGSRADSRSMDIRDIDINYRVYHQLYHNG